MKKVTAQYEADWLNDSPVGKVVVVIENGAVRFANLDCEDPESWLKSVCQDAVIHGDGAREAIRSVKRFFSGDDPDVLDDWIISPDCARTPFVQSVYDSLRGIGFGRTITYGELATLSGHPGAARAVGSAMARNPVPLFIPCHRVLPVSGCLGGFTGGVHLKRILLKLENVEVQPDYRNHPK